MPPYPSKASAGEIVGAFPLSRRPAPARRAPLRKSRREIGSFMPRRSWRCAGLRMMQSKMDLTRLRYLTKVKQCALTRLPRCGSSTVSSPSGSGRSTITSSAGAGPSALRACCTRSARAEPICALCASGSRSPPAACGGSPTRRRREIRELNDRSDRLAARLLGAVSPKYRERLVAAMADVHRLLRVAGLVVERVHPANPAARWCVAQYFAELDRRFPGGFDPAASLPADDRDLVPPRGAFLVEIGRASCRERV